MAREREAPGVRGRCRRESRAHPELRPFQSTAFQLWSWRVRSASLSRAARWRVAPDRAGPLLHRSGRVSTATVAELASRAPDAPALLVTGRLHLRLFLR